jgi:hypothetical protein
MPSLSCDKDSHGVEREKEFTLRKWLMNREGYEMKK